jgi:hypothetical protein
MGKLKHQIKLSQAELNLYSQMYKDYNNSNIHQELAEVESQITGCTGNQKNVHIVREVV